MVLRFGNRMFEPLWNSTAIDHVQITVAETVGLEGRVSYYDGVGALKDMVQNHMLQILSIIAMEPPAQMDSTSVARREGEGAAVAASHGRRSGAHQQRARAISRRARSRGSWSRAIWRSSGSLPTPRPSWPLRRISTTGAGPACPSTCAPASACPTDSPRSSSSSSRSRTASSSAGACRRRSSPTSSSSACSPTRISACASWPSGPGLDRQGMQLEEVGLDVSLDFPGERRRIAYERPAARPARRGTRPCSSAVTRSRRNGPGSTASWAAGGTAARRSCLMPRAPGGLLPASH